MTVRDDTRRTRETSLGWLVQRLARRYDDAMNERLSEHGLSIQSFAVMMTVLEHGPLTQSEIGQSFGMPAYTISRAVDLLEEKQLVARRVHETSRRAHSIAPTAQGLALAPDLRRIVQEVNEEVAAPLSAEERAVLSGFLGRLVAV